MATVMASSMVRITVQTTTSRSDFHPPLLWRVVIILVILMNDENVFDVSGALVAFYPISGLNLTYLNLVIRSGSWYESGNKWGEMHLLEHVLFKGTEKLPTKTEIDDFMEDHGITCNAFTGGSRIEIAMRFPNESIDFAIFLLSQMVFSPVIRQKDIETEKRVIHQEYTDKWSKVDIRFYRKTQEQLFGTDSAYIRDGIGDPDFVDGITEGRLKETHARFFVPSNMYLGLAGGGNLKEIKTKLKAVFPEESGNASTLSEIPIETTKERLDIYEDNLKSSSIKATWIIQGYDDYSLSERILLSFGSYLIGGSRRSVLNKKIREEFGLAYSVNAEVLLLPSIGWFQVKTSTKPESVDEVIVHIKKTISDFLSHDIDPVSFQRAKKFIKWQRLTQYDYGHSAASYISDSLYWDGKLTSREEFGDIVDKIDQKDFFDLFSKIIKSEPYLTLLTPKSK